MERRLGWLSGTLILGALWSSLACATLGEPETSITAEPQLSRASIKQSSYGTYRVHEMQLPSGTLIREYVGNDGNVFAVSWNGPFIPNLRQTLGAYFDEYAAEAGTPHGNRKHLEVRQPDLVVVSGGHMRAHHGIAYLPQKIPSGVSVGDLQ
ncbi:MAG TPA: DUF2844 domain-containing protein [Steroidobacteraceae bacterium]|nr:DUF2844 domain-containing protein [Steroidobacteraceae bacterium]